MTKYVASSGRSSALRIAQRRKMARSVHAYVRGSTDRFYAWLAQIKPRSLPTGPRIWICGDCHVGNLGPIAGRDDEVQVGIRDLDQTAIGNPVHDLLRLSLSLASAARSSNLPGSITVAMLERVVCGYCRALGEGRRRLAPSRPERIQLVVNRSVNRSWRKLMRERLEDTDPTIPLGARYWPLARAERSALERLAGSKALHGLVRDLRCREDDAEVRFLDAAYWKKGCGSLGRLRYALLFQIGRRKSRELCLIDVKEAPALVAPHVPHAHMPADAGTRVLTGARALSPALGQRMLAAQLLGRPVFLRELRPQDLKLDLERLERDEATGIAEFLAWVVGYAHAQQLDTQTRQAWRRELRDPRARSAQSPRWLWNSVTELLGMHETEYLEYCRRFGSQT